MMAERRYSARHPIDLKVQILYHGRRFLGAQGRNLSNQGMYLEVRNVTLPTGTLIELELECLGREWLLEAVVTHRCRAGVGVGVMFREPQPVIYQGLTHQGPVMPPPQGMNKERTRLARG
jgi:hypothetical protein